MASRFLGTVAPGSGPGKRFRRGLNVLVSLPEATLRSLCEDYPRMCDLSAKGRARTFVDMQLKKYGLDRRTARSVIDHVFAPIVANFGSKKGALDEPTAIAADLIQEELISPDHKSKVEEVLGLLKEISPGALQSERFGDMGRGVLPEFESAWTSVGVRAVLDPLFNPADDPNEFIPRIVGQIPVASMVIALDDGSEVGFECEEDHLEVLIRTLIAAQRALRAFAPEK